jgi:TatD DNase family protein
MTLSLVDTHAHLDDVALWNALRDTVDAAQAAGVQRILAVGSDLQSSRKAVEAAGHFSIVYAAVGVHPHEADRFMGERRQIEALLDAKKVVAVGEIGLDYYRDRGAREAQINAFETQLRWARERELPASVHNREADEDVLHLAGKVRAQVVLHAFSSGQETAERAVQLGAFLSFAGNLTYPKVVALRDIAREVPEDHLLIETDAPVLAPQPRRGRTNLPAFLPFTFDCLVDIRGAEPERLAAHIRGNANRLFRWDCP